MEKINESTSQGNNEDGSSINKLGKLVDQAESWEASNDPTRLSEDERIALQNLLFKDALAQTKAGSEAYPDIDDPDFESRFSDAFLMQEYADALAEMRWKK